MPQNANSPFLNRELSWLEFNSRVLHEAMDETNPLLERLKFIGIVSSNLDEFFMVRIASLSSVDPLLSGIRDRAYQLMKLQNEYFLTTLVAALERNQIKRLQPDTLNERQMQFMKHFFQRELLPVLTPIGLSNDHDAPALLSLSLYLIVGLSAPSNSSERKYAVIAVPKNFPRMLTVPSEEGTSFVLLEDVISFFVRDIFVGFEVVEKGLFRITRAAEMSFDEGRDEDFAKVMAEALQNRKLNSIMRLETNASDQTAEFLKHKLKVADDAMCQNTGWFDLKSISMIAFQPGYDNLKNADWQPKTITSFESSEDMWEMIKSRNILAYHPYESFRVVTQFLDNAAQDPDVLAIKQTLYRTDKDSSILRSLERAAQNGKQVTVLVELKARFDEEKNIEWAHKLEMAGATVLYGVAGYKTHAKACLVVRRESEGIKRYVHLGTGNYNEKTARIYSDISYFSSDDRLGADISSFFNMVTGYSQPIQWQQIEVAPFGLRRRLLRLIGREAMRSTKEKPGLIIAKMNSLVDPEIIEALYSASQKNVRIKLNVRGICCLKPGILGMSENIEVVSIIDMFLEHSRILYLQNGGDDEIYLSSADWMPRNLDRRIEIMFPIQDDVLKRQIIETLDIYFSDNVKSWKLEPSGAYTQKDREEKKPARSQKILCERSASQEKALQQSLPKDLKPQRPKPS